MFQYTIMFIFFTIHVALCSSNKKAFQESVFTYQKYVTQDYAKILFFKKHTVDAKEKKAFLGIPEVRNTLGNLLRYNSIEDGFSEQLLIKKAKYEFVKQAHTNTIAIPVGPSDALLLKYWNKDVSFWKYKRWIIIFDDKKYQFHGYSTIKKPSVFAFLDRIVKEENSALSNGKRLIYHTTNKELYMLMKIQALILEYKSKKKYPHFLPLRNPALTSYVPDGDQVVLRREYLKEGVSIDHGPRERYHLLSGNHSIFSNLDQDFTGESTLQFLVQRFNVAPPKILLKFELRNIFVKNGMSDFYEKNKRALKSLILDGSYGILLRLEFDQDLFEKTCYFSLPYGKHALSISEGNENNTTNSYMNKIIEQPGAVDNLDTIQLRVILDHDLLLNPDNQETQKKFKVSAYAVNQKSLDDFNREVTKLFDGYRYRP